MWSIIREALDKTLLVVKAYGILHIANSYVCTVALAYGPSMIPTINLTGDLILADRISPRLRKVGVGDIVIVRSPVVPSRVVTKRVVGMEGDRVTYLLDPQHNNDEEEVRSIVVPRGHVWIQGDNIYNSKDSRDFGPVPYGLVEARLFWRVWPAKDFGPMGHISRSDPSVGVVFGFKETLPITFPKGPYRR